MEALIITIVISIVLFFIFRGIMLWYWKVDVIIKNQEETNRLLNVIAKRIRLTMEHNGINSNSDEEKTPRV